MRYHPITAHRKHRRGLRPLGRSLPSCGSCPDPARVRRSQDATTLQMSHRRDHQHVAPRTAEDQHVGQRPGSNPRPISQQ